MPISKSEKIEGHKGGHYISGVATESGNHKDHKRWMKGKKRPDLDALEAGDPDITAIITKQQQFSPFIYAI